MFNQEAILKKIRMFAMEKLNTGFKPVANEVAELNRERILNGLDADNKKFKSLKSATEVYKGRIISGRSKSKASDRYRSSSSRYKATKENQQVRFTGSLADSIDGRVKRVEPLTITQPGKIIIELRSQLEYADDVIKQGYDFLGLNNLSLQERFRIKRVLDV